VKAWLEELDNFSTQGILPDVLTKICQLLSQETLKQVEVFFYENDTSTMMPAHHVTAKRQSKIFER